MVSFIEALEKTRVKMTMGWTAEPLVEVVSYNMYVGVTQSVSLLYSKISPRVVTDAPLYKKVVQPAVLLDVQNLLGLPGTVDFSNTTLYWAITYVDINGVESPLSASRIVKIPPVGIMTNIRKEDPSANRHIFGFSYENQNWIKVATTTTGAFIQVQSDFYADNLVTNYSYDSSGRVSIEKIYPSDSTSPGSPAKLVQYTYGPFGVTSKMVSDSTV